MEKGADDSRDSGHHRGHLGDCDSPLHHRCSVLLSAPGSPGALGGCEEGAPHPRAHEGWGPGRGGGSGPTEGASRQPWPGSQLWGLRMVATWLPSPRAPQTPCKGKPLRLREGKAGEQGWVPGPCYSPHPAPALFLPCPSRRAPHVSLRGGEAISARQCSTARRPSSGCLTLLCLSFPTCKMAMILMPASRCGGDETSPFLPEALGRGPGLSVLP